MFKLTKEQISKLNEYFLREFGEEFESLEGDVINLAYTETELGVPIEVELNLKEGTLILKIDDKVYEKETIESEEDLTILLNSMTFDGLVSDALFEAEEKEEEKEEEKLWKVPVTWEVYGTVEVVGKTKEEALANFKQQIDDIALPLDSDYVEGSFNLSADDDEENIALMEEI